MFLTKHAVVLKAEEGGLALVEWPRVSACGDRCAACGACGGRGSVRVSVRNPLGAQSGQRVEVALSPARALSVSALIFLAPVILLVAGLLFRPGLGGAGFAAGLLLSVCADRRAARRAPPGAIMRICGDAYPPQISSS